MKKADGDEQAQMFYCTDVLLSFPSFYGNAYGNACY